MDQDYFILVSNEKKPLYRLFQEGPYSITSCSYYQDALALAKGKIAQICSDGLIMSVPHLWNLINNELFLRDPSKQLSPMPWNRSSVRRAYSGETRINVRAGLLHFVSLCF